MCVYIYIYPSHNFLVTRDSYAPQPTAVMWPWRPSSRAKKSCCSVSMSSGSQQPHVRIDSIRQQGIHETSSRAFMKLTLSCHSSTKSI